MCCFSNLRARVLHKMQPFHAPVYGSLNLCFELGIGILQKIFLDVEWMNQFDVTRLLASAYLRGQRSQNAVSGVQSLRICPYNRNIFSDTDYAAASVTNRPNPDCTPASSTHPLKSEFPH